MTERNWGVISNGTTFEDLVASLISFEDPKAKLFGRRGPDGGQDSLSGDRKTVYQAKYHINATPAAFLSDAKGEAAKIEKYKKSGHQHFDKWKDVKHWILVTNADFNSNDEQNWKLNIIPLFNKLGLSAEYWERRKIDAMLDRHIEVDRRYFQNRNRMLMSVPERRELTEKKDPVLRRPVPPGFFGREQAIKSGQDFIETDIRCLLVHGPGGIGKTRFLYELGEEISVSGEWQVFWANIASMNADPMWTQGIIPERKTVLIVDEPENENLLKVLFEQIGNSRMSQWKLVVAVRSPKDPVMQYLREPENLSNVKELSLEKLSDASAESMCLSLLESGLLSAREDSWKGQVAKDLASQFFCHPIWITMAVYLLEKNGDLTQLPNTAEGLAEKYLADITKPQDEIAPKTLLAILRWVALFGTVNRENSTEIGLLQVDTDLKGQPEVLAVLEKLVQRNVLFARGMYNRLVEIKPDVLRDHILKNWLTVDIGQAHKSLSPSSSAKELVDALVEFASKGQSEVAKPIAIALARTEFILYVSGKSVDLLGALFFALNERLLSFNAEVRIHLIDFLEDIAEVRCSDTVHLARRLRLETTAEIVKDGIFGKMTVSQQSIDLRLGSLLYGAGKGVRTGAEALLVLREMLFVAERELEIEPYLRGGKLPNDGRRTKQLIGQILEQKNHFGIDFNNAAATLSVESLGQFGKDQTTNAGLKVLEDFIDSVTAIDRQRLESGDFNITIRQFYYLPSSSVWQTRIQIRKLLQGHLESSSLSAQERGALWKIFAELHRNMVQGRGHETTREDARIELLEDLKFVEGYLLKEKKEIDELNLAREMWQWHFEFDNDNELKLIASRLEIIYLEHPLAKEFDDFFGDRYYEKSQKISEGMAKGIISAASSVAIRDFLERAVKYLGAPDSHRYGYRLGKTGMIAWELGRAGGQHAFIIDYLESCLARDMRPYESDFVIGIASGRIQFVRETEGTEEAFKLLKELLRKCWSESIRVLLLERTFDRRPVDQLASDELTFFIETKKNFEDEGRILNFLRLISAYAPVAWSQIKPVLDGLLQKPFEGKLAVSVDIVADGIQFSNYVRKNANMPNDLGGWLLSWLFRVPDQFSIDDGTRWAMEQILKATGKPDVIWFLGLYLERIKAAVENVEDERWSERSEKRLSSFVEKITGNDSKRPEIKRAVCQLVALNCDREERRLNLYISEDIQMIDPEGFIVCDEVIQRISLSKGISFEALYDLAKLVGQYPLLSSPWRKMASPILKKANLLPEKERISIYREIHDEGVQTWSGKPGQVSSHFTSAVEKATKQFEDEKDEAFMPYFEWRLNGKKSDLEGQEQFAKEDRGE